MAGSFFLFPILAQADDSENLADKFLRGPGNSFEWDQGSAEEQATQRGPTEDDDSEPFVTVTRTIPKYKEHNEAGFNFLRAELAERYYPMPAAHAEDIIQEVARKHFLVRSTWPTANEIADDPLTDEHAQAWLDGMFLWPERFILGGVEFENVGLGRSLATTLANPISNAPFTESEVEFLKGQPGLVKKDKGKVGPSGKAPVATPDIYQALFQSARIRPATPVSPEEAQRLFSQAPRNRMFGSGRGSIGRQPRAFDRREIVESIRSTWEGILREPADLAALEGLATDYINEAQAMWMGQGASMDLEAFLKEKLRAHARYRYLYEKLPAGMSEREYMARFDNTTAAFGLRETVARPAADQAAAKGIGQESFAQGLSKSRPVRRKGGGTFTQRFAQTLASMGGLGRS